MAGGGICALLLLLSIPGLLGAPSHDLLAVEGGSACASDGACAEADVERAEELEVSALSVELLQQRHARRGAGAVMAVSAEVTAGGDVSGEHGRQAEGSAAREAVNATAKEAESLKEAANSTAKAAANSTAKEAANSTANDAMDSTAKEAANSTAKEAANSTARAATNSTAAKEAAKSAAQETTNSTAKEAAKSAVKEAGNSTAREAANSTAKEATSSMAAKEAANSTAAREAANSTAKEVMNLTAKEAMNSVAKEAGNSTAPDDVLSEVPPDDDTSLEDVPFDEVPDEAEAEHPRPAMEGWTEDEDEQGPPSALDLGSQWGRRSFCESHHTGFFCRGSTRTRCCRRGFFYQECGTTVHSTRCGWHGDDRHPWHPGYPPHHGPGYGGGHPGWHAWAPPGGYDHYCESHHVGTFCGHHTRISCCKRGWVFTSCSTDVRSHSYC